MHWHKQIFFLILILFTASTSSFAIDYGKLLQLSPLPSVRYKQIAENAEKNKLFSTASYGLIGGWILFNNISKGYDAYRVNNILAGSTLIVTAALDYMMPNSYMIDQKLIDEFDMKGLEKETLAYFEIKSKARTSLVTRRTTALMYFMSSLSSAVIAGNSPSLTENERFWTNFNSIGFLTLAAYQLFWPKEVEIVAKQMDKELIR